MGKLGYVYLLTNKVNTVLYTGVTSNLVDRIWQHKNNHYPRSFSSKYKTYKLVYFEIFESMEEAIQREKYIKGKVRKFKDELIFNKNPFWHDLYEKFKKEYYGD